MVTGKIIRGLALLGILLLAIQGQAATKRYLVQFKSPQTFQMVAENMQLHSAFTASGMAAPANLNQTKVTDVLSEIEMVVVESADKASINSLRQHSSVSFVEEEVFHPAPEPMATHSRNNNIRSFAKTVELPWGLTAVRAPQAWKVTEGRSARVLVLDTGIDKQHPSIAARFEKARNLMGGNENAYNDDIGHGTHVAGTILGGSPGQPVGVAPQAKLLAGKVCSNFGCSSIAIAQGINWAAQEKVDVINMSLGGMMITNGELQALARAESAGVFVAAASGNGGVGRVSYPAAVPSVVAVGAIDQTLTRASFSQWGPELDIVAPGVDTVSSVPVGSGRDGTVKIDLGKGMSQVNSLPMVGAPLTNNFSGDLVYVELGRPKDFSNVDVRGKIAFISRGEITFKEKVDNAILAGASAVILFNNAPGLVQGSMTEDGSEGAIPAAMIEQTIGNTVRDQLLAGHAVQASISIEASDYANFQGTSMATPHVAGVAALVRSANPRISPADLRALLSRTAIPLGPNNQNEYGAGLVNAEAAVNSAQVEIPLSLLQAN